MQPSLEIRFIHLYDSVVKVCRFVKKNPKNILGLGRYFVSDLLSLIGFYNYEHKLIFIAGAPKSGTSWLVSGLAKIPGYNVRPVYKRDSAAQEHNISDAIFSLLPKRRHSIVKLHTQYSEHNFEVISRAVTRFVVTVRDPRDICVSRYFHSKNDPAHRHHEHYNSVSVEEGLGHSLQVVKEEYIPWILDWCATYEKFPEMIKFIRYEDMNAKPAEVFADICAFYGLPNGEKFGERFAQSRLTNSKDLSSELKTGGGLGLPSTAREGKVGTWRKHISRRQAESLADYADPRLTKIGYDLGEV